jgi:hypothetical protein
VLTVKEEQVPHVRPEPTPSDRKYEKERDGLLERAGRRLAKMEAAARERADYMKRRR